MPNKASPVMTPIIESGRCDKKNSLYNCFQKYLGLCPISQCESKLVLEKAIFFHFWGLLHTLCQNIFTGRNFLELSETYFYKLIRFSFFFRNLFSEIKTEWMMNMLTVNAYLNFRKVYWSISGKTLEQNLLFKYDLKIEIFAI